MKELNFDHSKKPRSNLGGRGSNPNPEYARIYRHENKYKGQEKAIGYVSRAIKKGLLPSLKKEIIECVECGYRAQVWHHSDYNRPLDVVPVCKSCNAFLGEAKFLTGEPIDTKLYYNRKNPRT